MGHLPREKAGGRRGVVGKMVRWGLQELGREGKQPAGQRQAQASCEQHVWQQGSPPKAGFPSFAPGCGGGGGRLQARGCWDSSRAGGLPARAGPEAGRPRELRMLAEECSNDGPGNLSWEGRKTKTEGAAGEEAKPCVLLSPEPASHKGLRVGWRA